MIESNDHWHIITQPTDDYLSDRRRDRNGNSSNSRNVDATEGCSKPEYYDETHDIERCNEGSFLIDKETGEKSWYIFFVHIQYLSFYFSF